MRYKEAFNAAKGCGNAFAAALENLPQASPDPNQEACIACRAIYVPVLQGIEETRFSNGFQIRVPYQAEGKECKLSPTPDEKNCTLAEANDRILQQPHSYPVDEKKYRAGKINIDPLKGKLPFEK